MEFLDPKDHEKFMKMAWDEAKKARCQKSHFGAVIVKDGTVLASGHNEPVGDSCKVCLRKMKQIGSGMGSELCFAVHAEYNAIIRALKSKKDVSDAVVYIGHLKEGKVKEFSGKPFCTTCSRLVAIAGLKGVILYNGKNFVFLDASEFNEESYRTILENHGIEINEEDLKATTHVRKPEF